jgi:multidrug resistance efflux pump
MVVSLYPKLRKDLVVSKQETSGKTTCIIKDPVTGRFFHLKDEEQFIVQQLDGVTPQDVIRKRVEERFNVSCSSETLEHFLKQLSRLGLLEGESQPFNDHKRVRGNVLYLRFAAFDPDRLFNRLIKKVGFFFTSHFVVFSIGLILLASGVAILNWDEIWRSFRSIFHFQAIIVAWMTTLFIITAHEFAHGLACKHFGGQVHDIGFMLLYFQPAFYCNVSDAWLFPDKSKRLWVSFAGAYFEVFLWALATLIWRLTEPGTVLHFQALVVMAASGIATLFNLNPLIKLDGYYMLSDYLEIPNLRQRAFNYLGSQIKKFIGMVSQGVSQEATTKEKRIYVTYGVLAWTYSFLFLGFIAIKSAGYLVDRYQGVGFILFAAIFLFAFRNHIRRVMVGFVHMMTASMKRLPALVFLIALLIVLFFVHMELKVSGEFTILPIQNADIRAEVEGVIQEIYVNEGDTVDKGGLIATLCDRDYSTDLQKVGAELYEKGANLNKLKAGPREEEIELARNEVEKAQERLKYAKNNAKRFKELLGEGLISRKEFEESEEQMIVRQKELEAARGKLGVLSAGSRREDIDAARAEVSRLKVQQHYLEEQLRLVRVVSPVSGVVTTHNPKEKVGQNVKKGDLIAEVHELGTVKAEIVIPEKEIADVEIGQKVALKVRAYPNLNFEGNVVSIAPIVNKGQERWEPRTILVTTELHNASKLLKPEMTGNAKIFCGQRRIFDLMTRRLARYVRVEFWSWW